TVTLQWTSGGVIATYFLERSTNGLTFIPVNNGAGGVIQGTQLTYTDTGLSPDTAYTYRVTARNVSGQATSDPVATRTLPNGTPKLQVTGTLAFPITNRGRSSLTRFVVIKNVGTGTAKLTGNVGTLAAPFVVTSGAGAFSLSPGQTKSVGVVFRPTRTGTFRATLVITSNGGNVNIAVSGTGR